MLYSFTNHQIETSVLGPTKTILLNIYMTEFDERQTELQFYGTTSLGCKIGLAPAGANTDDIITKHYKALQSLLWFLFWAVQININMAFFVTYVAELGCQMWKHLYFICCSLIHLIVSSIVKTTNSVCVWQNTVWNCSWTKSGSRAKVCKSKPEPRNSNVF